MTWFDKTAVAFIAACAVVAGLGLFVRHAIDRFEWQLDAVAGDE